MTLRVYINQEIISIDNNKFVKFLRKDFMDIALKTG